MKKYRCEMCGKIVLRISEHHIIPWYLSHDDLDSNIMRLCDSCHKKADASFNNLILYGKMNVAKDTAKRVRDRYSKKYCITKTLFCSKLLKGTYYFDALHYNIKTGNLGIYPSWNYYSPHKYCGAKIKSRALLSKAALSKGQTNLMGK